MYVTGYDLLGAEVTELSMRCIFVTLIYGIIAYKFETLTKMSFMGREAQDKAFHRWMKIFETFPEGITLVRNNYILYANRALHYTLNVGIHRTEPEDDPLYELLKNDLRHTFVQQWVRSKSELKRQGLTKPKRMSVWEFLVNNEKGAIF
jgi:hypothetical protein